MIEQHAQHVAAPVSPARRAAEALLITYLCLLPIHWAPLPFNLQWADVLFPLLLVAAVASRPAIRLTTLDVIVVGYVAAALPSFASTPDARASAVQFAKDIYMAAIYFVVAVVASRVDLVERIGQVIAWTGTIVATVSLAALALFYGVGVAVPLVGSALPVPYVGQFYRLYGTFPSPEYLVNFLIFAAPFAFARWTPAPFGVRVAPADRPLVAPVARDELHADTRDRTTVTRPGWVLALVSMIGAALGAMAHGIVGLVAALIYCLAAHWRGQRRVLVAALVGITVILAIVANLLLVFAIRGVRVTESRDSTVGAPAYTHALHDVAGSTKVSVDVTYDLMAYWLLKQVAWRQFQEHPIAGGGLASLHQATRRAEAEGRLPPGHGDDDPHSTWFGRLGETGVIGASTLAALWAMAWVTARRAVGHGGMAGRLAVPFVAGLIGIVLNSLNADAMHFRFVWIAIGALRAMTPAA